MIYTDTRHFVRSVSAMAEVLLGKNGNRLIRLQKPSSRPVAA